MRPQLFEVMDESWAPMSLRLVLREVLETCNSRPFRDFNDWLVAEIADAVARHGFGTVVELGAGTAPLTRRLLGAPLPPATTFVVADLNPDRQAYEALARESSGRVAPILEPTDYSLPRVWPTGSLLILSTTFHHLPPATRLEVLRALEKSNAGYLIAESIRHNWFSFGGCLFGWLFALVAPLFLVRRHGTARRVAWCWLLPVAPFLFMWDGLVSVWRCWTEKEWRAVMTELAGAEGAAFRIRTRPMTFSMMRLPRG